MILGRGGRTLTGEELAELQAEALFRLDGCGCACCVPGEGCTCPTYDDDERCDCTPCAGALAYAAALGAL